MKARFINEGTYEDFFMNYGTELKNAIEILSQLSKKVKNEEIGEEELAPEFDKLERIYDQSVVDYIFDIVTGGYGRPEARDIAQVAMDNMNARGTEMQMILYAIEELGSAVGIYPEMDESLNEFYDEDNGRSSDNLYNYHGNDEALDSDKLFKVVQLDEDGRRAVRTLGIWKANDDRHARKLAAAHYDNDSIVNTGFYDAVEITRQELEKERIKLEKALSLNKIMNESLDTQHAWYEDEIEKIFVEYGMTIQEIDLMLNDPDVNQIITDAMGRGFGAEKTALYLMQQADEGGLVPNERTLGESLLNETSLADMYREMGTWYPLNPSIERKAEATGITTENNPELAQIVDDWMSGMYDEDPDYIFNQIEDLIMNENQ